MGRLIIIIRQRIVNHILQFMLAFSFGWIIVGCDKNVENDPPPDNETDINLSMELESNCFGWPDQDFSPTNYANLTVALDEGMPAVEFALKDTSGEIYTLSSLLETKPVMLVFGSFT